MCTGVKDLLAGEQQAAVTVAVEGLMDAKPAPELESFATFDPRVCDTRCLHAEDQINPFTWQCHAPSAFCLSAC